MLALTILSIFILIIVFIIFLEYRNEKKYQEKRRQNRQAPSKTRQSAPPQKPKEVTPRAKRAPEPKPEPEPKLEPKPEPVVKPKPVVEPEKETEVKQQEKPEVKIEVAKETKKLPEANYPEFTHVRLVEMGLSDEEAKEFVAELIPQIEVEIPLLQAAIEGEDFHKMERLTHGIKGSATNLGTGGVSDLLVDYNTYLKSGTDIDIAKEYLKHLIRYTNELKTQYA